MSFNARTFIFDGVPCEEYGLMLYYFDNPSTRESSVGTNVDIMETRLNRSTKPIFYGTTMNEPMQFSMTFGSLEPMTKYEVDLVSGWLTGHSEYKWLEIIQDDLADVRYKCFINNLNEVTVPPSPLHAMLFVILSLLMNIRKLTLTRLMARPRLISSTAVRTTDIFIRKLRYRT